MNEILFCIAFTYSFFIFFPHFQAVDQYNPFLNSTTEVYTIGSDSCETRSQPASYCNGPLKPGTTYRFKIRAFTAKDKYTDTFYSAPITTGIKSNTKGFLTVSFLC